MILTLKQNSPYQPSLYMNGQAITETSSHKHLGLTFTNNCNWNEYINNITAALWTRLNLLRVLKFKINRQFIFYFGPLRSA